MDKVIPVAILLTFGLFLHGFFPIKRQLPGFSIKNATFLGRNLVQPEKLFDKVVLVLIDALRDDFVSEKNFMSFVKSKTKYGTGRHFTLRAHPPTVTLPRIKALTTGSIPGFIDIVLNFDSAEIGGDNIISQAYRDKQRIVFYGDDTWIKLFPHQFMHSDGTTSFFVTDYTEVDDNVTRHIDERLSALDWDLMILHYLGLDHIGHTAGPNSPLVVTKLAEMDNIIAKMYNHLDNQGENFVMLVCGDHGMSDQGSHGGASDREVMVPAVFISPRFGQTVSRWRSSRELLQIDLAPTLSMLMGLPIPNNNLGQGLVHVLDGYADSDKLSLLYINCQQVLQLMGQNVPDFTNERSYHLYTHAVQLHEDYIKQNISNKPEVSMVIRAYETAMDVMATKISKSLTTYDVYSMTMSVVLMFLGLVYVAIQNSSPVDTKVSLRTIPIFVLLGLACFGHMTVCTSQSYSSSSLCGRSLFSVGAVGWILVIMVYLIVNIPQHLQRLNHCFQMQNVSCLKVLLLFGTVMHTLSFLSSSFVEEEHQTWYFLSMAFYLVTLIQLTVKCVTRRQYKKCEIDSFLDNYKPETLYDINDKNQTGFGRFGSVQTAALSYNLRDRNKKTFQRMEDLKHSETREHGSLEEDTKSLKEEGKASVDIKETKGFSIYWRQMVAMVTVMCIGRFLRTINQTGDKWLNIPDLGDWLVRPENKVTLTYVTIGSLLAIAWMKIRLWSIRSALFVLGLAGCLCYRMATGTIMNVFVIQGYEELSKGISEAHFVYGINALLLLYAIVKYVGTLFYKPSIQNCKTQLLLQATETVQLSWILLMTLLLRPHNTIFVAMVTLQEQLLWTHCLTKVNFPVWVQTLICWWIGQATYFQQGNSNSLSTVDVSAGYVGLDAYNPVLVVCLLHCSTYAGPVLWLLTLIKTLLYHSVDEMQELKSEDDGNPKDWYTRLQFTISQCIRTLTLERLSTLCVYCIMVTVERYHLFVWTVFSPKLLYEGMLTLTYVIFSTVLGLLSVLCL